MADIKTFIRWLRRWEILAMVKKHYFQAVTNATDLLH